MAEEGYKTTTIYQTRIALFNMMDFAKENDVIINNPCKKPVKSDMGKPSDKKEALTIDVQKRLIEGAKGQSMRINLDIFCRQFFVLESLQVLSGMILILRIGHLLFQEQWSSVTRSVSGEWVRQRVSRTYICYQMY